MGLPRGLFPASLGSFGTDFLPGSQALQGLTHHRTFAQDRGSHTPAAFLGDPFTSCLPAQLRGLIASRRPSQTCLAKVSLLPSYAVLQAFVCGGVIEPRTSKMLGKLSTT
jgi:hypothetical protein